MKLLITDNTQILPIIESELDRFCNEFDSSKQGPWSHRSLEGSLRDTNERLYSSNKTIFHRLMFPVLARIVDWSSEEEKQETLDYMRANALSAQSERDFCATFDSGEQYLKWTPLETIEVLMTYKNGVKLKHATVAAHREFILSRIKPLFSADEEVIWTYKDVQRQADRGYSLRMIPLIGKLKPIIEGAAEVRALQIDIPEAEKRVEVLIAKLKDTSDKLKLEATMLS